MVDVALLTKLSEYYQKCDLFNMHAKHKLEIEIFPGLRGKVEIKSKDFEKPLAPGKLLSRTLSATLVEIQNLLKGLVGELEMEWPPPPSPPTEA